MKDDRLRQSTDDPQLPKTEDDRTGRIAPVTARRKARLDILLPAAAGVLGALASILTHVLLDHRLPDWTDCGIAFTASAGCMVAMRVAYKSLFSLDFEHSSTEERLFAFLGAGFVATVFALEVLRRLAIPGIGP